MKRYRVIAGAALGLATLGLVASQGSTSTPDDPNAGADPGAAVSAPVPEATTIAQLVMIAPASSTSINPTVHNLSNLSTVGARELETLIIDCFFAVAKEGMTIDSASASAPAGGTATVTTGNDADDVGPAVIQYTSFNAGDTSVLFLDPDTWDNASFGATRRNMVSCRVEAVFAGDLRASGSFRAPPNGTVVANLNQRNP